MSDAALMESAIFEQLLFIVTQKGLERQRLSIDGGCCFMPGHKKAPR